MACLLQTPLPEQEGATEAIEIDLELFSMKELAYHMTLFDWDLFWSVHEVSLVAKPRTNAKSTQSHFSANVLFVSSIVRTAVQDFRETELQPDHGQLGRVSAPFQRDPVLGHHRSVPGNPAIEASVRAEEDDQAGSVVSLSGGAYALR